MLIKIFFLFTYTYHIPYVHFQIRKKNTLEFQFFTAKIRGFHPIKCLEAFSGVISFFFSEDLFCTQKQSRHWKASAHIRFSKSFCCAVGSGIKLVSNRIHPDVYWHENRDSLLGCLMDSTHSLKLWFCIKLWVCVFDFVSIYRKSFGKVLFKSTLVYFMLTTDKCNQESRFSWNSLVKKKP